MDQRQDDPMHAPCLPEHDGGETSAEPIEDSIWRGGAAMVAPGCFFDLGRVDEAVDPQWRTI
ncbi:MAG: hypothetical protein ABI082_09490 [Dokdonella sp.]